MSCHLSHPHSSRLNEPSGNGHLLNPTVELTLNYEGEKQKFIGLTQLVGGCYRTRMCACGMPICAGNIAQHFFTAKLRDYECLFLVDVRNMTKEQLLELASRPVDSDDGNIPIVIDYQAVQKANREYLRKPQIMRRKFANVIPIEHDVLLSVCMEITGSKKSKIQEMMDVVYELYEKQIPSYVREMRPTVQDVVQGKCNGSI